MKLFYKCDSVIKPPVMKINVDAASRANTY